MGLTLVIGLVQTMKTFQLFFFLVLSTICLGQDWKVNFDEAKTIASEKNIPIILVFQGSDWCAPCIKLDKEIWSTETFRKYAEEHYVMLQADFPRKKANKLSEEQTAHNGKLAEKYNQQGFFPHVVVLDKEGNVLGRAGYEKKSPEQYIQMLNSFLE